MSCSGRLRPPPPGRARGGRDPRQRPGPRRLRRPRARGDRDARTGGHDPHQPRRVRHHDRRHALRRRHAPGAVPAALGRRGVLRLHERPHPAPCPLHPADRRGVRAQGDHGPGRTRRSLPPRRGRRLRPDRRGDTDELVRPGSRARQPGAWRQRSCPPVRRGPEPPGPGPEPVPADRHRRGHARGGLSAGNGVATERWALHRGCRRPCPGPVVRTTTGRRDAARMDAGATGGERRPRRGRGRGVHGGRAQRPALHTHAPDQRLRRLVRERLSDRHRHRGRADRVPARDRSRGRARHGARALRPDQHRRGEARRQHRRLALGEPALAEPRPADPQGHLESGSRSASRERDRDARLRAGAKGRAAGLRLPRARLRAGPLVARHETQRRPERAALRQPRRQGVPGLAHRHARHVPSALRHHRLLVRPRLPRVRRAEPLRPMVGLAARARGAPPAHPRHRHRRPPSVSGTTGRGAGSRATIRIRPTTTSSRRASSRSPT